MTEPVEELQEIIHGELNGDTKENFNFNLLKQLVDGKSDGVTMQLFTESSGLTLADGVKHANLAVVHFKNAVMLYVNVDFDKTFKNNAWTDTFFAPVSIFDGLKNATDNFSDLDMGFGQKTHVHILCDPSAGKFPAFVYANESNGIQDNTYANRIIFVH